MNKNDKKRMIHIPYASKAETVLYISLACGNIAMATALSVFIDRNYLALIALAFVFIYLLEVSLIGYAKTRIATSKPTGSLHEMLSEGSSVVLKQSDSPVIAFDGYGTILWYNEAMSSLLDPGENYIGRNTSEIIDANLHKNVGTDERSILILFDRIYSYEGFTVTKEGDGLYVAQLKDITELSEFKRKYSDERVAIAYIAIDNVEDIYQYVHERFTDIAYIIDDKLKAWAASMNGILRSYDDNKYIMLFDEKKLRECRLDKFAILDEIRKTRVGDGVAATISIGVTSSGETLAERDKIARDAIDLAIERGGDQAVDKSNNDIVCYGGRTKAIYKRTGVRSRSFASQLSALMVRSDNVLVMGHRFGDFDSFGSSVGIARLAMICGIKVNIAVDMRDKNLAPCVEVMQKNEIYSRVFVDNAEGLDLINSDTLVVLVDHAALGRSQFDDISKKASKIAVVDHHRKSEELPETVLLDYIVPYASSTCELVTEMLESSINSQCLLKDEADMLLSGILLDTKQFTRNTGTRTFSAAQYLRSAGANPTDVYSLFKTAPEDLAKEARFHTDITMYRGNIAIASCDGETDETYRIIASKAADKMLTLKGVDAAFALVRINDSIHISGRSNGSVNVQLILEKLHGGGHFEVAGAQVLGSTTEGVLLMLKDSIDEYCDGQNNEDDSLKIQ